VSGITVVFCDSKMGDRSSLEPLSGLMKSKILPEGNVFVGAPAKMV